MNLVGHHGLEHIDLGCGPGGGHCGEDARDGGKSYVHRELGDRDRDRRVIPWSLSACASASPMPIPRVAPVSAPIRAITTDSQGTMPRTCPRVMPDRSEEAKLPGAFEHRPRRKQAWTSAIIDRCNLRVRWPDRHAPVQRTLGPFADVPVLVLSGDLDANTPTEEGRQAARQFRDARVIEVPNLGHVPERASRCPAAILTHFFRRLQVGDTNCLADIPPIPVP